MEHTALRIVYKGNNPPEITLECMTSTGEEFLRRRLRVLTLVLKAERLWERIKSWVR